MQVWEYEFEWLRIRHQIKESMNRDTLPDLNAILFLIGIQELGFVKEKFSKEEKQDLMHIAICHLLSDDGYFEFEGRDADGWPHWKVVRPVELKGVKEQEQILQEKIIKYFKLQGI